MEAVSKELAASGPHSYPCHESIAWSDKSHLPPLEVDEHLFLPCALNLALAVEWCEFGLEVSSISDMARFPAFQEHLALRNGQTAKGPLPPLPVPPAWQEAFDAWARGERGFRRQQL